MTRGDADLDRAKDGHVGQDVAFLAQEDEPVGLEGLDVVDRQVLLGTADQTGRKVDSPLFDELGGLLADAIPPHFAVCCSSSYSFQSDGTCGTIYDNHCAPPQRCAWPEPGWCVQHLLGSPCA